MAGAFTKPEFKDSEGGIFLPNTAMFELELNHNYETELGLLKG